MSIPIITGTGGADELFASSTGGELLGLMGPDKLTGGAGADILNGGGGNDNLSGGGGNDVLIGGGGADAMAGGTGNDTYSVDQARDTVTEAVGGGYDTVHASVSWLLGVNLEELTLIGGAAINATGNTLANVLRGNVAANVLDGKAGADAMAGGAGDDTYIVDNAGDTTVETANGGLDNVQASISWLLAANVENLTLTGTAAINATGNTLANVLTGNAAANILNGGGGVDTLAGGAGNDTYYVDAADVVTELAGAGTDTVVAALSWGLGLNLENLTLTGTSDINATGNALANILQGNAGDNLLNGGAGADTMVGGAGDDVYVVDHAGDVVAELAMQGTDSVYSLVDWSLGGGVENLVLTGWGAIQGTGNDMDNSLTGNAAANILTGGLGGDTLDGLGGADWLAGGEGNDHYWWGRGYEADVIVDDDASPTSWDLLHVTAGVSASQLWLRQQGNDLEISIIGTADRITVQNWYLGAPNRIEVIYLDNGQFLRQNDVQPLVDAMAGLAIPAAGQFDLPSPHAGQLAGVIAVNWQWPADY